ncbi:Signal recognition particle receptor subunit alpha like protein [Dictyocoela muelleri]|nr:Signal recognition particle receptor subunit alpha like protein [Dictyocoela muelleri]
MIYTAIFTSTGNILKSKGKRPQYLSKFINNQLVNSLNSNNSPLKIQGNYIHYIIVKDLKNFDKNEINELNLAYLNYTESDIFLVYLLIDSKKIDNFSRKNVLMFFNEQESLDFSIKHEKRKLKEQSLIQQITFLQPIIHNFRSILDITNKFYLKIFIKLNIMIRWSSKKFNRKSLYNQLVAKNVSIPTVERIIEELNDKYEMRKDENYTFNKNEIKKLLIENIKIYEPEKLLSEIKKKKRFVIGLVGPNGVGKSTSLSKLVYWLTNKNLKVLIVACDTFRAGAVEQLKKHARELGVDLYERGYGKDENQVLMSALEIARNKNFKKPKDVSISNITKKNSKVDESLIFQNLDLNKDFDKNTIQRDIENGDTNNFYCNNSKDYDVIVVDTSGRMHNNNKLIDQLRKMTKKMDHVIFVCEALVGSDGLDQLSVFSEFSDSVFLTKIDSCGSKVGSVVDMAREVPILFFGVGQRRVDMIADVSEVVDLILE